jgi:SnoaL-like domain
MTTQMTTGITTDEYLEELCLLEKVQAARALLDQAPWAVRRVIGAINSGDTQRLLDFFPEGVRLLASGEEFVGRARVREFSDRELIGAKGYLDVRQVACHEDTVTVSGPYYGHRFTGPVGFVFTVEAGRITELSIENTQESAWLS